MKNKLDRLVQSNARRAPSISQGDLGNGKFAPQSGKMIPVSRIRPSPYQPRLQFGGDALQLLQDSIKASGLDTPILVRPISIGEEFFYELIDGQRRLTAVKGLGWDEIAANVRELADSEAAIQCFTATAVREDYTDYEKGLGMQRLLDEGYVKTKSELGTVCGCGRGDVYRYLGLASLPQAIKVVLNEHPALISGTGGEYLTKMIEAGDEDLAVQAVLLIQAGKLKESYIKLWYGNVKANKAHNNAGHRMTVRQDDQIRATLKANTKGGFDISVVPRKEMDAEVLRNALTQLLKDLNL